MSQPLSPHKIRGQTLSECLTLTTSSLLTSSLAFLFQPSYPNTSEIIDVHFRRIRGAGAIHAFQSQNHDENSSDTRDLGFGEYKSKGSWWDKIFGRMKRGFFILALVAFGVMLLYAMSLKARLAGMEANPRRTVWVQKDVNDFLNGDKEC
ncbi:hypothetical protein V8E51_001079 [Hyaloscypha variabilis]|jgi:hypothetical protein